MVQVRNNKTSKMDSKTEKIVRLLQGVYCVEEYPALADQIASWQKSKPLTGLRLLDVTPVFRNTMVKYVALMEAGAELTVGLSQFVPHDAKVVAFLRSIGVEVIDATEYGQAEFDIILDCAGEFAHCDARLGYVELTRSGVERYEGCPKPVFVADSGRIKRIETLLGTGESLFRAMRSLGHEQFNGRKVVLFGSGKVGSGIIIYGASLGAQITVVTDSATVSADVAAKCTKVIDHRDVESVMAEVSDAFLVVTATGRAEAISDRRLADTITVSSALLANMGVEDEFGQYIPQQRVLNNKKPLNFILDEPTHMKYIEATMALHNAGALYIATHGDGHGLIDPPAQMEQHLLEITSSRGVIASELHLL